MIDFGLVALFTIQFLLAIACGAAFLSIKTEIRTFKTLHGDNQQANQKADLALKKSVTLIDETIPALAAAVTEQKILIGRGDKIFDEMRDELKSLSMKLAAFKRWNGKTKKTDDEEELTGGQEAETPPQEQIDTNQLSMFPSFGKRLNRKAG